ncbi:hypothetical protein [Mammaliicoccus fleurettii]|uniref:hypothetical protein n=1 Tax=Mammaliicoccus fleurettii TaxID=150056 RepID=UPI002DB7BBF1|nr:hypothetical protein [Mammaliicoccus fleurettii]MEB7723405.1 hypothetical protein [Mammaliicoccus fleurettii]
MKLYLITLTISVLALYAYTKRYQRYASVQDGIDPPIDYESDKYKESETWFTGVGRH